MEFVEPEFANLGYVLCGENHDWCPYKEHVLGAYDEYMYCNKLKTDDFDCKNCKYKKENNNGESTSIKE